MSGTIDASVYQNAERLHGAHRQGLIPGGQVRPRWIDGRALLEGESLLIHGGMDDNVSPQHTLRPADRLLAADKDFDLLIVPPEGYRLKPTPLDMDLISGFLG
ncbi:prolyl oligopeptidase family serine peptidase [Nonomuraea sp. JJY05]|uniref:prolyl oligopeptidase family serine peptidase n=1 Tax=Nonomuraea sp. JJY05 TaxID=3350255 RepID=UPI00373EC27A